MFTLKKKKTEVPQKQNNCCFFCFTRLAYLEFLELRLEENKNKEIFFIPEECVPKDTDLKLKCRIPHQQKVFEHQGEKDSLRILYHHWTFPMRA